MSTIRWDHWSPPAAANAASSVVFDVRRLLRHRDIRPVMLAAIVAVAYYIGASVGFLFQSPSVPQSVLWLPNSILLAALLMNDPRRWLPILAAAFPAQMLVAWQNHAPLVPVSLLFITNCADAALGAALLRWVTNGRWSLRNLNELILFIVLGAVLAPLLVSFVDAGITVATGW